jgi:beta-glucanase (GH16 family)
MIRLSFLLVCGVTAWLDTTDSWAQPAKNRGRTAGPAEFVVEAGKPFADDFSEAKLDRSRWNVEVTGRTVNNEQQAYVDSTETLYIVHDGPLAQGAENDGVLVIHPRWRESYSSESTRGRKYDFISGRIDTRSKVEFTHGTAAARIKMIAGDGLWPAFWLLGNGAWPATGEIDIMEYVGDKSWVSQAVHGPGYSGNTPLVNRFSFPKDWSATDWHVYSVDWSDSEMVFKVDSKEVYRATKAMVEKHGKWVFDTPKFVILNFALGGGYPEGVNHVRKPYRGIPESTVDLIKKDEAVFMVDWVRVTKN